VIGLIAARCTLVASAPCLPRPPVRRSAR
jgi:hypothetical protein